MSSISFSKTWASGDILYAADLEAMKAAIIAVVNGDLDNANLAAAAAIVTSKLDTYMADATEAQVQTNPFTNDSFVAATDMRGDFARLRYVLATMLGSTYWYERANHGVLVARTGFIQQYVSATPPSGWILLDDGTIGETGSGASNRANDDTEALYTLLYNTYADAICPVSTGRGANATADFEAGKTLGLPPFVGRLIGPSGTPRSANETDTILLEAASSADSTHITLNADYKFLTDDLINGYTVTVTAGSRNGEVSAVSDYVASTGVITLSPALTGALGAGDSFTLKKAVPTRANGAMVGLPDLLALGSPTADLSGTDRGISAFGLSGSATDAIAHITNYAPSVFIPHIIKL